MSILSFQISMLEWAANNIGLRLEDAVSKVSNSERIQRKLLEGKFTIKQAETFAEVTKVPFGTLFLKNPPASVYKPSIPDLRQKQHPEPLSDFFYEILEDVKKKQDWYVEYLHENDAEKLDFVGKYANYPNLDADVVANDIRKTLNLPINLNTQVNRDNYLKLLINRCENVGILVFRNSIVKNATRKSLDTNEFRGFVLNNEYAPVIFLNSKDMPSALIFTLAHELAHIWLGDSGVDDLDIYGNNPTEVLCNKIAASVLVSKNEFCTAWSAYNKNMFTLSDVFHVSKLMIARLALTYQKISNDEYKIIHEQELEAYKNIDRGEGGPSFIKLIPSRNSRKLTETVVNQALSGNLLLRDAGRLLNVSPHNIMKMGGL